MQPDGPYRFTEMMGVCQVGKAWWAVDGQDRLVTVAVLEPVVADDPAWRQAFSGMADALAAPGGGGGPYLAADFTAPAPWVAYPADGPGADRLFLALGHEIHSEEAGEDSTVAMLQVPTQQSQPAPWAVQGDPTQVSAPPQPVSTPPVSTPPHQVSSPPVSAQPVSVAPQPVSTPPHQVSTPPHQISTPPHQISAPPVSPAYQQQPSVPQHDPFDSSGGRRIAPVRPEPKRRDWISVAVALVLTLVAGTAGFFLGRGSDERTATPSPSASTSLPPYEATQFSINKAKFEGELAPLAEPWLTRIGGCVVYGQAGTPKLPADEKGHVFCHYGGAWLHFALYPGQKQEDTARAYRQQLNLAGGTLAPGMREAAKTTGGVTGAAGNYVEYAFENEGGQPICGVWWDRDDLNGAFYVETLCKDGVAGNWDALRDLWRRGS
ncbi:hypothetical protein ACSNN7_09395 [Micromonospora sp. URMC 105]|uniref:hypothetical protein n=1 Tax=Micromonospora sp. URMC 105 TaxID=3423413 RepID=UPI003F1DD29B